MNRLRQMLAVISVFTMLYCVLVTMRAISRSEALREYRIVRFDVPPRIQIWINGKHVTNPVFLRKDRQYEVEYRTQDGEIINKFIHK